VAYIGVQPKAGQYRKLDDISGSFNGATATFNLTVSNEAVSAATAQQLMISLGGVIQNPGVDYTVATNTITFTTNPASGLDFFGVLLGDPLNTGTPSDGTVTTAKLASDLSVDLASGTAGTPSLTFDPNSGLFSPANDEVSVSTNGTERFRFGPTGEIGIGGATYGTSGQVLTSGGSGAAPTWADASSHTLGVTQATTSGTAIDFTSIGANVRRISLLWEGVSTSGTSDLIVQLMVGGVAVTTGYLSTCFNASLTQVTHTSATDGFNFRCIANSQVRSGILQIATMGSNLWVCSGFIKQSTTASATTAGDITLAGALDGIRLTTTNGTDTFDAGSVNILLED